MYCQNCGSEVRQGANYCPECGSAVETPTDAGEPESVDESGGSPPVEAAETEPERSGWDPRFPITSVFCSIILLWTALDYGRVTDFLIFGVPAILIIPRVRRRIVPWVRERFNEDLASTGAVVAIGAMYGILLLMAVASVIGSTGNDPTVAGPPSRQLAVSLATIGIMYLMAIVVVTAIRANRKLTG